MRLFRRGRRLPVWSKVNAAFAGFRLSLRGSLIQGAGLLLGMAAGIVVAAGFLPVIAGGSALAARRSQKSHEPTSAQASQETKGNPPSEAPNATDRPGEATPDSQCAACHRAIYEKYEQTPMARASGPASNGLIEADFHQPTAGVEYRIRRAGGNAELSFRRPAVSADGVELPALEGSRTLRYFIGSGLRGRTYLFETEGYWFEAPINWYARRRVWDMAPNFLAASEMPLTLPVDPGCLRCHASGAQPSLPAARNKYAGQPFLHGGITCEGCHGDPAAHLASDGRTPMIAIDQLTAEKRDSVCLSCHMEGQAAIVRAGKRLEDFQPGESLWDYARFFVHANEEGSGGRATGQWEALLGSRCKQASGERLTCTSCHDPHGSDTLLTQAEKVNGYRARCLSCHETPAGAGRPAFSARHHPEQPDCTLCHMQRASSTDIAHEQVTDHRIVAHLSGRSIAPARTGPLLEIGPEAMETPQPDREPGLAYAQFAALGDRAAYARALAILRQVADEPSSAADAAVQGQLGFLEQMGGADQAAAKQYARALQAEPQDSFAEGNLGMILARHGRPQMAVRLWQAALESNPAETTTGINLATVECGLGDREDALAALERALSFAPDDRRALELRERIRSGRQPCGH